MKPLATLFLVGLLALAVTAQDKPKAPATDDYFSTFPATPLVPLDPRIKAELESAKALPIPQMTPADARAAFEKRMAAVPRLNEPVAKVDNRTISGPAGKIPLRVYTPKGQGPFSILVYFHGGGWVIGSIETVDDICRSLCSRSGSLVVSVDYRLAPEHKFPAAVEDCYAAVKWCADNGAQIGGDGKRLAVAGDSAGGNLSAAVSLYARDKGGPKVALQVLIYPAVNQNFDTASYFQCAAGYGLSRDAMIYYWKSYLPRPEEAVNPYACPLQAKDLAGLPPALVLTAQYDVLRDEGEAYAARLKQAGVPVQCTRYLGMNHGFIRYGTVYEPAKRAVQDIADTLRRGLDR